MPKRIKDKNTGIVVKFYQNVIDQEILDLFNSLEISGSRASNLVNRWAVEVPFWKEESFAKKLSNNEMVEKVYTSSFKKKNVLVNEEITTEEAENE